MRSILSAVGALTLLAAIALPVTNATRVSFQYPKGEHHLSTTATTLGPVVDTAYGKLQGFQREEQGIHAFKGIPYAAPPVGDLRFAPTAEVTPWGGILNATEFSSGCMAKCSPAVFPKPTFMCPKAVSEDCLYLNIFTPTLNASANLPVILFIHGGDFTAGAGGVPLYDGGDMAANQNVVVVTINYRLGLLGGLYTGTVLGNMQILDQRMSFKWVKNAIANFGGNPNKLTITGQSAGAFSVATHFATPGSWDYFAHGISVSNPYSLLASTPELAVDLGKKALAKLNCPQGGDPELACLRAANADLLRNMTDINYDPITHSKDFLEMMMRWVPVVDGTVLPYQPQQAMELGKINKVPYFFGTVANESVQFIYDLSPKKMGVVEYDVMVDFVFGVDNAKQIKKQYGALPVKYWSDARPFLSVIATDYLFYCVGRHVGGLAAKTVDTFMYYFDQVGTWNEWCFGKVMPYCVNNVCHASDLAFIFNPFYSPEAKAMPNIPIPTQDEEHLSQYMQTMWGNFARTGNPNIGGLPTKGTKGGMSVTFPEPFNGTSNVLVNLSMPVSYLDGYRNSVCDFWDGIGYYRF